MSHKVERLPIPSTSLGEGPHWDSKSETLYLVDLKDKILYKYVPATKEVASAKVDTEGTIHFIIPVTNETDLFALATGRKVHIIRWDGRNNSKVVFIKELMEVDQDVPVNVLNDGKVDRMGNLFTGTIGIDASPAPDDKQTIRCLPTGSFYCRTKGGDLKKLASGVICSNGLAFDPARQALYHVDSFVNAVRKFDYDEKHAKLSNKSVLFDYKKAGEEGFPDGMTIDTKGNIWVASFNGGKVLNINPDSGEVIKSVKLPTKVVTSCTWGGKNLDVLFVTTGKDEDGSSDGGTYAVTGLNAQGYENFSLPL